MLLSGSYPDTTRRNLAAEATVALAPVLPTGAWTRDEARLGRASSSRCERAGGRSADKARGAGMLPFWGAGLS